MSLPEQVPVSQLHPRVLAYLGDAVYELHLRGMALAQPTASLEVLHRFTTQRARASFQVQLLQELEDFLTEEEQDWVRRGRNVAVSTSRRHEQALHRQASGFETLIGFLYLSNPSRLEEVYTQIHPSLTVPIS